jgi:hypothetical protein
MAVERENSGQPTQRRCKDGQAGRRRSHQVEHQVQQIEQQGGNDVDQEVGQKRFEVSLHGRGSSVIGDTH